MWRLWLSFHFSVPIFIFGSTAMCGGKSHSSVVRRSSSCLILPLLVYRFPLLGATHSLNDFLGAHPLLDLRL